MKVEIKPSIACGIVSAPPSKSVTHRALICGALSDKSIIKGIAFSNDIKATLNCLEKMGATVNYLSDNSVEIGGLQPENISEVILNSFESGSTLRFLIPLALFCGNKVSFTGSQRLFERPLSIYEDICKKQNIEFIKNGNVLYVNGKLKADKFNIDGSISSQFISGLMFALPLLENESIISLSKDSESLSYLDITVDCLREFGVYIENIDKYTYLIKGNQKYSSKIFEIEGDYSNSAFLDAFNCFKGKLTVSGLNPLSAQGDKVYKELFEKICKGTPVISLKDCPDLAPVLFMLSAAKNGAEFVDTSRLKIKESDRVESMRAELEKFGAKLICKENSVTVIPTRLHTPTDELCGHNDHRIVMALSILCSVYGGIIDGAQAVSKSYPDFFEVIETLGIMVKKYDN